MTASGFLALVLHALLMVAAAFGLAASGPLLAARLCGRAAPPLLQPWHDWRRLLRKRPVCPESASRLFAVAPLASLAMLGAAMLLVPSFTLGMATAPAADLIVVAGLLMASRAVLSLAALDAGSAGGALGAVGTLRTGLLAEPALLLAALILSLLTGGTNLPAALAALRELALPSASFVLLVLGLAAIVGAAEAEESVITGCFSGWLRAAAEAGVAVRRVIWLALLAALLAPGSLAAPGFDAMAWAVGILAWAAKLLLLGLACALAGPAARVMPHPAMKLLGGGVLLVLLGLLLLLTSGELA